MDRKAFLLRRIRVLLTGFTIGVVLSGITAFPLTAELGYVAQMIHAQPGAAGFSGWIARVYEGLVATDAKYPFIAYGTDWLAFGHLVIAAAFWGPLRAPVRNAFIVRWGMFCCLSSIPVALICGPIREIPFWWRVIDCSFGLIGIVPLLFVDRDVRELARLENPASP
jgi:hypothetical protein